MQEKVTTARKTEASAAPVAPQDGPEPGDEETIMIITCVLLYLS